MMVERRGNPWLGAVSALLGGVAAFGTVFAAARFLTFAVDHLGSMLAVVFIPVFVLLVGTLLSGFLLTVLLPTASEWGPPAGWLLNWGIVGVIWMLNRRPVVEWQTVFLAGVVATILCLTSYGGVLLARHAGPQRCRDRSRALRTEPRCPACGYVLYYAKDRTCPDCGRRFTLQEIDTRRALWDEGVLKPWESAQPAANQPRSGGRM